MLDNVEALATGVAGFAITVTVATLDVTEQVPLFTIT